MTVTGFGGAGEASGEVRGCGSGSGSGSKGLGKHQHLSIKIQLLICIISSILFIDGIVGQQQQQQVSQQQQQQPKTWSLDGGVGQLNENGERVDKLSSATGDLFWRPIPAQIMAGEQQQPQIDWLKQLNLANNYGSGAASGGINQPIGYFSLPYPVDIDSGSARNYHAALVDEFKQQYSPLANPNRDVRAFKPKLMSTARGFGKRAYNQQDSPAHHITYADLLAAANQNAINANGKLSGSALSSKYSEWIGQVLSRWPTMDKYVNNKYQDFNGDGVISTEEKYQSL